MLSEVKFPTTDPFVEEVAEKESLSKVIKFPLIESVISTFLFVPIDFTVTVYSNLFVCLLYQPVLFTVKSDVLSTSNGTETLSPNSISPLVASSLKVAEN